MSEIRRFDLWMREEEAILASIAFFLFGHAFALMGAGGGFFVSMAEAYARHDHASAS